MKQWINVAAGLPQLARASSLMPKNRNPKDYRASGFNEYGDETQHWALESSGPGSAVAIKGTFNEQFGKHFIRKIRTIQKTCSVFVIPPIYVEKAYNKNKKKVVEVEEFLQEEGCPFIVAPEAHVLKDEYAYDTNYHMNRQGVNKYTAFIIEELKPLLKDKGGSLE
ncbi:MAG: hypothetical protein LUE99_07165 [Bacteroides sp.]|nr:hypothetical protein [Bacteroides sp.]